MLVKLTPEDCYLSRKDSGLQGGDILVVKPQMSKMDTPLDHAQEQAMTLVEWALAPMGHCNPKKEYDNVIASTNHLEILCFITKPPLARLPKPTKSVLTFCMRQLAQ